ncbi:helix-turn-helix transcriptional regulator [Oerskovia sp. M15]
MVLFERRIAEPLLRHVVGGILRAERTEQARTLLDVALTAQVSTAYLSEVERGRKEASSEVLAAICRALGMRVVDLLARGQEEFDAEASRVAGVERRTLTSQSRAGRERIALGTARGRRRSRRAPCSWRPDPPRSLTRPDPQPDRAPARPEHLTAVSAVGELDHSTEAICPFRRALDVRRWCAG